MSWLIQATADGATYLQAILLTLALGAAASVFTAMVIKDLPGMVAEIKKPPVGADGSKQGTLTNNYTFLKYHNRGAVSSGSRKKLDTRRS